MKLNPINLHVYRFPNNSNDILNIRDKMVKDRVLEQKKREVRLKYAKKIEHTRNCSKSSKSFKSQAWSGSSPRARLDFKQSLPSIATSSDLQNQKGKNKYSPMLTKTNSVPNHVSRLYKDVSLSFYKNQENKAFLKRLNSIKKSSGNLRVSPALSRRNSFNSQSPIRRPSSQSLSSREKETKIKKENYNLFSKIFKVKSGLNWNKFIKSSNLSDSLKLRIKKVQPTADLKHKVNKIENVIKHPGKLRKV